MMEHFEQTQPELNIQPVHKQIVILAALLHDIGHGPFSHLFDNIAHDIDPTWNHEMMGGKIIRYINEEYKLGFDHDVIEAVCAAIMGETYGDYPKWLFQIVANHDNDIDIDKFDYLSRDMNRTLNISRFEYDRLIVNCHITEGQLSWRLSEIPTIERLFFNRNDMHNRVYKHRVVLSVNLLIEDLFDEIANKLNVAEMLESPKEYSKYDDRILYLAETGHYGPRAAELMRNLKMRKLYACIGEIRIRPDNKDGMRYSQQQPTRIEEDIDEAGQIGAKHGGNGNARSPIRIVPMTFRYGLNRAKHPLLSVPFWIPGSDKCKWLTEDDISCIVPAHFAETAMRAYCSDPALVEDAKAAFKIWLKNSPVFQ